MIDAPVPSSESSGHSSGSGASRRRRRRRNPWKRRIAWLAGSLIVISLLVVFSLRIWVSHYLKSEAFARQLNATAGRTLAADCRLEGVMWMESAGYAETFAATGTPSAAFRHLAVSEVRANLDLAAVWDRVWRVTQVRIAKISADFSEGGRLAETSAGPAGEAPVPAASGSWLERRLPNRTELGTVLLERFDFTRAAAPGLAGFQGDGFSLIIKPDLPSSVVRVEGQSGKLRLAGEKRALSVDRFRATVRPGAASLDQLAGRLQDTAVTAEGTIAFDPSGDLRMKVSLDDADLEKWLPEDWLRRCSGQGSAQATLRGDWRKPETLLAEGDFKITGATLQALPLLDIIAKKTQNASFLRMQVKEAAGRFERSGEGDWALQQFRADAPGLLRLKGRVDVGAAGTLSGSLILGIVPGTLQYLAGAEQTVFVPAAQFSAMTGNDKVLNSDDTALLWTRFQLGGTLDQPSEDLSERLARAWFNATVDEVSSLSMEAAATVTRTATGAAKTVLEAAPPLLEKAPALIDQGVQGGLKMIDGLLPR